MDDAAWLREAVLYCCYYQTETLEAAASLHFRTLACGVEVLLLLTEGLSNLESSVT